MVNVVINQEYNEKYEDKTSPEYIEFVGNFTNQMEKYYLGKNIANFKEVIVISVSRGGPLVRLSENTVKEMKLSADFMTIDTMAITPRPEGVSVVHDVVLAIPNNASSDQLYEEDLKAVREAADELVKCAGEFSDCPYNVTSSIVNATEVDLGSVCDRIVDDPDVAAYYEALLTNGVVICVTICNSLHSSPKTCYNKGVCRVYRDIGPLCECQNVNSTWYLGNDCRFPIQRTPFYAGLSVTLACLLVTVGALTAYVLVNKHKKTQRRDIKEKLVNQWLNEDFEWSRSNSATDTYSAGDYGNPSFTHDESAMHREDPDDYRQPVPVYQLTPPSLHSDNRQSSPSASMYPSSQTIHGHNTQFSNGSPVLTQRDFSPNLPMRISRPQIRTSWDA